MNNLKELENKTVLITGSNGDIGHSVALLAKNNGATVYGVDVIPASHEEYPVFVGFLGSGDLPSIDFTGIRFDHIIHVAGGALPDEVASDELTDDLVTIHTTVQNNFLSAVDIVLATKNLTNVNGSFTFISSINAYVDYGLPIYSAMKSSLEGFMNGLLPEMNKKSLRVNVATLGTVLTSNVKDLYKDDEGYSKRITLDIPDGVSHTPETVAYEILDVALSSQTGQVFLLDKGQMEFKRNNRSSKITQVRF